MLSKSEILVLISNSGLRQQLTALEQKMGLVRDTEAAVLAKLKQQEPVAGWKECNSTPSHGAFSAAPVQQEPNNCAQCKKEYRKGSCVGCPKCAKGVDVAESEFQKPVQQGNQFNPDWDQQAVLVERVRELEEALAKARSDALEEAAKVADSLYEVDGKDTADYFAKAIRALKETK